jgi:hypothetical protein
VSAAHTDRRKNSWYEWLLQMVAPGLILLLVSWMAANQVQTKSDLRDYQTATAMKFEAIKTEIVGFREDLKEHSVNSRDFEIRNAAQHHRSVGMTPCNGCHGK